ncbi:hypothetical protein AGR4B_pAt20210 [Agrobacterium tumefaciens str. CFBP 5621]|nr:hypothetical protein AGR4B_pAt20210 [Agrobacterium tumefaciens str. CFBP 5621]
MCIRTARVAKAVSGHKQLLNSAGLSLESRHVGTIFCNAVLAVRTCRNLRRNTRRCRL